MPLPKQILYFNNVCVDFYKMALKPSTNMQRDFSVISLFFKSGFVSFTWEELPIHGRCFVTLQSWIMVCLLWAMVLVSI